MIAQSNNHFRNYGISDWLAWLSSVGEHAKTEYAPGFTEARFAKIRPGMTEVEVRQLVGAPLERRSWSPIGELWSYSDSVTNVPNFHRRDVLITESGKVYMRVRQYYCEAWERGL